MAYNVKIDAFEGPLDLLLHLINRLEIDIYDISVSEITNQYMAYIHTMKELQLDIAGDYLLMAATLLEMKSHMLLPTDDFVYDDEWLADEEDPRDVLIQRLIAYRQYKNIAAHLHHKEEHWQEVYAKPAIERDDTPVSVLQQSTSYDMMAALQKLIRRKTLTEPKTQKIYRENISVQSVMDTVLARLTTKGEYHFAELYDSHSKEQMVATFLAVLELMKTRQIYCKQEENFTDFKIYS